MPGGEPVSVNTFGSAAPELLLNTAVIQSFTGLDVRKIRVSKKCPESLSGSEHIRICAVVVRCTGVVTVLCKVSGSVQKCESGRAILRGAMAVSRKVPKSVCGGRVGWC